MVAGDAGGAAVVGGLLLLPLPVLFLVVLPRLLIAILGIDWTMLAKERSYGSRVKTLRNQKERSETNAHYRSSLSLVSFRYWPGSRTMTWINVEEGRCRLQRGGWAAVGDGHGSCSGYAGPRSVFDRPRASRTTSLR